MSAIGLQYDAFLGHTVHLVLQEWSTGEDGTIYLSPECRNINEIETWAEKRKTEIDRAVRTAKRKFAMPDPPLFPNR